MILDNLLKIVKSKIWIFGIILGIAFIVMPYYYFSDFNTILSCFEYNCYKFDFFLSELILTILITILFWIFFGATLYKLKYFSVKKSGVWFFAWLIWILVTGCPACSITFASYFGLAGIISIFPFWGLELKIISVIMLLYVDYVTIRDLEICKIKKK